VLLRKLQQGEKLSLPHSRPMPSIGPGCHELRVLDRDVTWRIFHYIGADAIVLLEITDKKTRETPKRVLDNCRTRLARYKAVQ
jgi:phage-related protein